MKQDAGINYNIELLANLLSQGDEKRLTDKEQNVFVWPGVELLGLTWK